MYRDDDAARAERANTLIDEIAELEKQKVNLASTEDRLDAAKRELSAMQERAAATVTPAPIADKPPSLVAHVVVFAATAGATFLGYTLLV